MLSPRVYGYVTCGHVNSRNHFGGFTGDASFVVVIVDDVLQFLDIDEAPNVIPDLVSGPLLKTAILRQVGLRSASKRRFESVTWWSLPFRLG